MIVVGGTYYELCLEPFWDNIFGSGFRAVNLLLECDQELKITYYTCCDKRAKAHLDYHQRLYSDRIILQTQDIIRTPIFYYDHPLKAPTISPRPDVYCEGSICLSVSGENILAYGLLEATVKLNGEKVVYDPQSPANPKPFSSTCSKADQLITIVNRSEAREMAGTDDIAGIREFFFKRERCFALILKMGAAGALLFEDKEAMPKEIPVFKTDKVWSIGSGDVFSAYFAYNWFKGRSLINSAHLASKATAAYCNTKDLSVSNQLESFAFPELRVDETPNIKVYLAAPFFTLAEKWLVNEIRNALMSIGLKVFSPLHDVGYGKAKDVVGKDIRGLNESHVVFAVIDGLDSGTLFEVGFAVSQGKKVIAFVQNESEEALKMLEGTDCIIEKDLTTAIYKIYWTLASD